MPRCWRMSEDDVGEAGVFWERTREPRDGDRRTRRRNDERKEASIEGSSGGRRRDAGAFRDPGIGGADRGFRTGGAAAAAAAWGDDLGGGECGEHAEGAGGDREIAGGRSGEGRVDFAVRPGADEGGDRPGDRCRGGGDASFAGIGGGVSRACHEGPATGDSRGRRRRNRGHADVRGGRQGGGAGG